MGVRTTVTRTDMSLIPCSDSYEVSGQATPPQMCKELK